MAERKNPTINIGGLEIEVASPEECEKATLVVCADASMSLYPDDVQTVCAWCRRPIVHRPYMPLTPPKVCMGCAELFAKAEEVQ